MYGIEGRAKQLSQAAEAHDARMEHLEDAYLKLLGAGNGTAVLATLGLIGAIIGRSADGLAPRGLLWVLIIFLMGLFGIVWWHCVRMARTAEAHRSGFGPQDERMRHEKRAQIHRTTELVAASIASLALSVGIIYGVIQLFMLTAP